MNRSPSTYILLAGSRRLLQNQYSCSDDFDSTPPELTILAKGGKRKQLEKDMHISDTTCNGKELQDLHKPAKQVKGKESAACDKWDTSISDSTVDLRLRMAD